MKQLHLFISGRVQGVGFRRFVRQHARKLGVTGWIKNLPDRQVEAVLQGDSLQVEGLVNSCRKGPFLAEVSDVIQEEEGVSEVFSEFSIR